MPSAVEKITANLQAEEKIHFNIGCRNTDDASLSNYFNGSQWRQVRLDIDPELTPDIIALFADMSMINTDSKDTI